MQAPMGDGSAQSLHEFGYLLELAAERELGSGRVLDKDGERRVFDASAFSGLGDGSRYTLESLFAAASAKRSRMQNDVLGAQGDGALDLEAKGR